MQPTRGSRQRRRWLFGIKFALVLLPILSMFARIAYSGTSVSGSHPSGRMDDVTIAISQWPTAPFAATYMVGMEKGFFKKEGINIKGIVPGDGGGTTVRAITSGGLNFGVVAPSAVIQSVLAGAPLKMLATENGSIANQAWVTTPNSSFNSLKDFCGKGVWGITSPGSTTEGTTALMEKKLGVDPSCVNTAAAGGLEQGLTLLQSGDINSAIIWEPILTQELLKGTVKKILSPSEILPQYTQTVIVAGSELIKENPDLVKRFIKAHREAQDWLIANPAAAAQIYAKQVGIHADVAVQAISRLAAIPDYYTEDFSVSGLTTVADGMVAVGQGFGKTGIPWKSIINQDFVPDSAKIDVSKLPYQPSN
jgi:NitT/TauT family transport system substrate-binding protein